MNTKKNRSKVDKPGPLSEKLVLVYVTDAFEAIQFEDFKQQLEIDNSMSINFQALGDLGLGRLFEKLDLVELWANNLQVTDIFMYYPSLVVGWTPEHLLVFLRTVRARVWIIDRSTELEWCADRVYSWKKKWKSQINSFD